MEVMLGNANLYIIFDMARCSGKFRRKSTVVRDNEVHEAYEEVLRQYGDVAKYLPRGFIYERIQSKTGLCTKTIAFILNHTCKDKLTDGRG